MNEDFIFYAAMWGAIISPFFWIADFFLLRKKKRGKAVFWVSFFLYLLTAAVFFGFTMAENGWGALAYVFFGCASITVFSLVMLVLSLILNKTLSAK